MNQRKIIAMTPELYERWRRAREQAEAEMPELAELGRRMREAAAEDTLTGCLRRAVHRSARPLAEIASATGIGMQALNQFLSGDHTLRSDVLDRLAAAVNFSQLLSQIPAATYKP
ncbi:MAG: hypothetical protein HUU22_04390 [Phycisphaerae bacterium]|nr:hypothetical protein [Phycisphaerae bacterium]NUQ45256.1 hypothetical protein [Phycisphaerae bacterium]